MNNGVNNLNENNTSTPVTNGREEIKAAKVYKLTPENAPKEIPKREDPLAKIEEKKQQEQQPVVVEQPVKVKRKNYLARFFFLIILVMAAYIGYSYYMTNLTIQRFNQLYSPVSTTKDEKNLDIESTIVQDLYSKVKTNIREDIAEPVLSDNLKLYLAFRQIPYNEFFDSKCDGFDNANMIPYVCNSNDLNFEPKAFKEEALKIAYKELFGENSNFVNGNIQIGKNCIGGYQYVASRKEYVQGTCSENITTTYRVNKKLVKATSKESIINLYEEVKYTSSEGQKFPDTLKNGTYKYTFRLDRNYNYAFVSKELEGEE